jgi:hypothetical protein
MVKSMTSTNVNLINSDCFSFGKQCRNGGQCVKIGYYYSCRCLPGFSGASCEISSNICQISKPCKNNGKCIMKSSKPNDYECQCTYEYEGPTCEKLKNPCENITCENSGVCISNLTSNDYSCLCKDKFTGKHCDQCSNKQFTGQNCSVCIDGFTGENCDKSFCSPNPCQNGLCLWDANSFRCVCTEVKFYKFKKYI